MTDFALTPDTPAPDRNLANFAHEGGKGPKTKVEWNTPLHVLRALGEFDLDPCAALPSRRPWECARINYDVADNGLLKPWAGRVWCNPPYETETCGRFMARLAEHGNGVALIFARTETAVWHDHIWPRASAILFLRGRLRFCDATGKEAPQGCAPSALIAYGDANADTLENCGLPGAFIRLRREHPPCPNCGRPAAGGTFSCDGVTHCGCYHSPRGGERYTAADPSQ